MWNKGEIMKRKTGLFILLTTLLLSACKNTSSISELNKNASSNSGLMQESLEEPEGVATKEVELFDTKITINDDWSISDLGEGMKLLVFQREVPEVVNNGVIIVSAKGALKGAKNWEQAEWYLPKVKESLINQDRHINEECTEELFEKQETPVLYLNGYVPDNEDINCQIYVLFSDYEDPLILEYRRVKNSEEKDYSKEVRKLVDNMKLSYEGFLRTSNTNSDTEISTINNSTYSNNSDRGICSKCHKNKATHGVYCDSCYTDEIMELQNKGVSPTELDMWANGYSEYDDDYASWYWD